MEAVSALRVNLTLNTSEFSQRMKDINSKLKAVKSEFSAANDGTKKWKDSLDGLRAKSENLNRQLELQRQKVAALKEQYDRVVAAQGADSRAAEIALTRYNNARGAMNRMEAQLASTDAAIRTQSSTWYTLGQRMQAAGERMQKVGDKMKSVGRDMTMKITTPIVGIGVAAVRAGANFEEGMSKVAAVSGATGDDFKKLRDKAEELGATTKFSATEAADGMQFLAMAGFKTNDILKSMPGMLNLAAAGALDLGQAADITSNIMSGFGIESSKSTHIADVLAASAANANTNVSQMGEAMKYLAPAAKSMGWSMEESAAAVMTLGNAGIQGTLAGQAFATSLTRLAKDPTKKMKKAMDELNFSFFDAKGTMKSLPDIIAGMQKNMSGWTDQQKAATITTIFGAEAYKHWAVLLDAGSGTLSKNTKMLEKADGASEKMAKTMSNNAKGGIKTLLSALENLSIKLSDILLPYLNKMVAKLTEWTRAFANLSPAAQKVILVIAGIAAAIGPVLVIGGTLISSIGTIAGAFSGLSLAIAGSSVGLSALAGPIGIAIAGIGLVTGAVLAYKKITDESKKANLDHAQSLIEQQKSMTDLTDKYSELRGKNKLSNDELLRFRDLQSELKTAKSGQEIKTLKGAIDLLQQKSGLSNDEMETMLRLNDQIVKKTPEVRQSFSDRGNSIIGNKDALNEVNAKLAENIRLELENQRIKAEANLDSNIRKYIAALDEWKAKEKERDAAIKERDASEQRAASLRLQAQQLLNEGKDKEAQKTIDEIAKTNILISKENAKVSRLSDEVAEKKKSLDKSDEEITKTQKLYDKMIDLQLAQAGINAKGADGIAQLDQAIQKSQKRVGELKAAGSAQGTLNSAQQDELNKLQTAIGKYQSAKSEIQKIQGEQQSVNKKIDEGTGKAGNMNKELGKNINKKVGIDDGGKVDELNRRISQAQTKRVTIDTIISGAWTGLKSAFHGLHIPGFAVGTNYAPGGMALVGENGPELMYVPRGAQIKTASETRNILSQPQQAVNTHAQQMSTQQAIIQIVTPDKREMARWLVDDLTEFQSFKTARLDQF